MDPRANLALIAQKDDLLPFGRDEMNLVELPLGPIAATRAKTLEVTHSVYDPHLKREVTRHTLITGSDAFGLPRPIDDQVLVGLKALTHEAHYASPKVHFSRYQLCRVIGWPPDGRSYQRLEDSFNRLAGTMLKFKNAWFDKGESEWMSKSFHILSEVELCSRDRFDRKRQQSGTSDQKLCYFVWSDVIFKSFTDGFIKTLDLAMFRRIADGRRRDVPLRLYRILDKKFHKRGVVRMNLANLATGVLGLCPTYSPSQMKRVIDRAARCLIEKEYLERVHYVTNARHQTVDVVFVRRKARTKHVATVSNPIATAKASQQNPSSHQIESWLARQSDSELEALESLALAESFGTGMERKLIHQSRAKGESIRAAGAIRWYYIHRFQNTHNSAESAC